MPYGLSYEIQNPHLTYQTSVFLYESSTNSISGKWLSCFSARGIWDPDDTLEDFFFLHCLLITQERLVQCKIRTKKDQKSQSNLTSTKNFWSKRYKSMFSSISSQKVKRVRLLGVLKATKFRIGPQKMHKQEMNPSKIKIYTHKRHG